MAVDKFDYKAPAELFPARNRKIPSTKKIIESFEIVGRGLCGTNEIAPLIDERINFQSIMFPGAANELPVTDRAGGTVRRRTEA